MARLVHWRRLMRRLAWLALLLSLLVVPHACGGAKSAHPARDAGGTTAEAAGITDAAGQAAQKIQHVVVIMQENRSFDHYFGTFPGAEGIPMDSSGKPTVCNIDPKANNACVPPDHETAD